TIGSARHSFFTPLAACYRNGAPPVTVSDGSRQRGRPPVRRATRKLGYPHVALGGSMEDHRVCGRAGVAMTALLTASIVSWPAWGEEPDLSGIYWAATYSAKIEIVGGGELPFTEAGKAAYEKNIAGLRDESLSDNARKFCVPDGLPRSWATPYPFEIVQGPPGNVTLLHEHTHQLGAVRLNKEMPAYRDLLSFPAYNGHSVGHYAGDTLVVETAGFNGKTFADATGAPQSDAMRTVERIRKIGPTQ